VGQILNFQIFSPGGKKKPKPKTKPWDAQILDKLTSDGRNGWKI
jgi:hypothetical protein